MCRAVSFLIFPVIPLHGNPKSSEPVGYFSFIFCVPAIFASHQPRTWNRAAHPRRAVQMTRKCNQANWKGSSLLFWDTRTSIHRGIFNCHPDADKTLFLNWATHCQHLLAMLILPLEEVAHSVDLGVITGSPLLPMPPGYSISLLFFLLPRISFP